MKSAGLKRKTKIGSVSEGDVADIPVGIDRDNAITGESKGKGGGISVISCCGARCSSRSPATGIAPIAGGIEVPCGISRPRDAGRDGGKADCDEKQAGVIAKEMAHKTFHTIDRLKHNRYAKHTIQHSTRNIQSSSKEKGELSFGGTRLTGPSSLLPRGLDRRAPMPPHNAAGQMTLSNLLSILTAPEE